MDSPSGVTVVLLYIVKTFCVAFSLLLSRRRSAGSKLQVAPLPSWNLIADLSTFNVANILFACFQVPDSRCQAVFIIFIFACVHNFDFCVESTLGCKVIHLFATQTSFSKCWTFVMTFFVFVSTKLACHKFL